MPAAVWKGHLSFGLVSIPVKLFRAARKETVSFRQLQRIERPEPERPEPERPRPPARPQPEEEPPPAVAPVRQELVGTQEDKPVSRAKLVKGYEYGPDRYVVVEPEEIRAITPKTSDTIDILEFVRFPEIDPIYLETSYYVAPDRFGEKPYSLLYAAMRQTGYAALARVAMHRREHILIVRPGRRGIVSHTMFYADEIRQDQEYGADPALVDKKELDLAAMLIESLAAPFDPEKYKDAYRARLQEMIEAKVKGREIAVAAAPTTAGAEVIDIMDALKQSLKMQRKPAAAEKGKKPKRAAGE